MQIGGEVRLGPEVTQHCHVPLGGVNPLLLTSFLGLLAPENNPVQLWGRITRRPGAPKPRNRPQSTRSNWFSGLHSRLNLISHKNCCLKQVYIRVHFPSATQPHYCLLSQTVNPFVMLKQILGDRLYLKCCLIIWGVLIGAMLIYITPSIFGSAVGNLLTGG